MKSISFITTLLLIMLALFSPSHAQQIVTLSWNDVVNLSRTQSLELRIQNYEYRSQRLGEWKSLSNFLPSVSYQYQIVKNVERPVFVIPNFGEVRFGTLYNFTHAFQLQYPLFTGGARYANWRIQRNIKKSLFETLQNKEEQVVLQALESYFSVILAHNLIAVNQRAKEVAGSNLEQVQKFYDLGAASQLDLLRAKSRYSSSLPALTSAMNNRKLSLENLKFLLDLSPRDSLIILDSLQENNFLENFDKLKVDELQEIALEYRSDLKGTEYQKNAAGDQRLLTASQFLPSVVLVGNLQHQAQIDQFNVNNEDYVRSKYIAVNIQLPLFEGGSRALDFQQSRINHKKAEMQYDFFKKSILLDVENNYNQYLEAKANLNSLRQAMVEAREALRLANLTYQEGISTQVEVLSAQLAFTSSEVNYQKGVFDFNITQLRLLKSIGKLDRIWENKG